MTAFAQERAELRARLEEFTKSISSMTDDVLFQTFRSIQQGRKSAKTGTGDGESEDLLLKGLAAEKEITSRHPRKQTRVYQEWLADQA